MPITGASLTTPVDLPSVLARGLATGQDGVAVTGHGGTTSWRDLEDASTRLAAGYHQLGLEPGDRVASLMPNRATLLAHYLACFKAGLVATPLNYRYTPTEIDHAMAVSGAAALVAHADRRDDVAASREVPHLRVGVVVVEGDGSPATDVPTFESLAATDPGAATLPLCAPDAAAVIFFTSGSTGPAKGVTHSLATLGWSVAAIVAALELTERDRVFPASSLSHIAAFIWSLASLSVGAPVVLARAFDPGEVLPLLREHRPTALAMIPAALTGLVRHAEVTRDDLGSLRLCHAAGDKVSPELGLEFEELTGLAIHEGFGMTEVGLVTINPPAGVVKQGSIGRPMPGTTISVRDEAGEEVAPGEVGAIWILAPGRTLGYWDQPHATVEVVRDGWLDTGDLAHYDADGYLWFFGRKKQIIVHDGSNISPIEVEAALAEHPAVAVVVAVGVPDPVHGENVHAFVTTKAGMDPPTARELIDLARVRIGYKAPEEIVFLDVLPLNATGKVDRIELKRIAEEHWRTRAPG